MEHEKIEPHPEEVTSTSSVHPVFGEKGVEEEEKDEDMLAGIKADIVNFFSGAKFNGALLTGLVENDKGDLRSG